MRTNRVLTIFMALGLVLGIHKGYIALLREDRSTPVQVFPYRAALLPEQDQRRLDAGIPIGDASRLHRLLEDYLS